MKTRKCILEETVKLTTGKYRQSEELDAIPSVIKCRVLEVSQGRHILLLTYLIYLLSGGWTVGKARLKPKEGT